MFKNINSILKTIIGKKGEQEYKEYEKIQKKWKKEISKKIQKNTKIIDFTNGIVTIKAKNSTWKNELIFMQEEIKKNFQIKKLQ